MAIVWEGAMRLMQYRALREARASSEMLMYNQAIDVCTKERLEARDYRRVLQVVNVTIVLDPLMMTPPPCEQSDNRQSNGAMERYRRLFEARRHARPARRAQRQPHSAIRAHA